MSTPTELQRTAMRPGRWVRFWRAFWPYQLLRFVILNVRMLRVIWRSHPGRRALPPKAPEGRALGAPASATRE